MNKIMLVLFILLSLNELRAQWIDNGNALTTTDKVGIGTTVLNEKLNV